jgi:hypothetical protein
VRDLEFGIAKDLVELADLLRRERAGDTVSTMRKGPPTATITDTLTAKVAVSTSAQAEELKGNFLLQVKTHSAASQSVNLRGACRGERTPSRLCRAASPEDRTG